MFTSTTLGSKSNNVKCSTETTMRKCIKRGKLLILSWSLLRYLISYLLYTLNTLSLDKDRWWTAPLVGLVPFNTSFRNDKSKQTFSGRLDHDWEEKTLPPFSWSRSAKTKPWCIVCLLCLCLCLWLGPLYWLSHNITMYVSIQVYLLCVFIFCPAIWIKQNWFIESAISTSWFQVRTQRFICVVCLGHFALHCAVQHLLI